MKRQWLKSKKQTCTLVVTNVTAGKVVCKAGFLANTFRTRLIGLLGRKGLDRDAGLLIRPSSGVHTFWMSFPIDIVSLDKHSKVIAVFENIGSGTVRGFNLRTRSVLELPAGKIRECGIQAGHELAIASNWSTKEEIVPVSN